LLLAGFVEHYHDSLIIWVLLVEMMARPSERECGGKGSSGRSGIYGGDKMYGVLLQL
jgi:hypothetical protein